MHAAIGLANVSLLPPGVAPVIGTVTKRPDPVFVQDQPWEPVRRCFWCFWCRPLRACAVFPTPLLRRRPRHLALVLRAVAAPDDASGLRACLRVPPVALLGVSPRLPPHAIATTTTHSRTAPRQRLSKRRLQQRNQNVAGWIARACGDCAALCAVSYWSPPTLSAPSPLVCAVLPQGCAPAAVADGFIRSRSLGAHFGTPPPLPGPRPGSAGTATASRAAPRKSCSTPTPRTASHGTSQTSACSTSKPFAATSRTSARSGRKTCSRRVRGGGECPAVCAPARRREFWGEGLTAMRHVREYSICPVQHNNIVLQGGGIGIYRDDHDADPARRFKAFGQGCFNPGGACRRQGGGVAASADGLVSGPDPRSAPQYTSPQHPHPPRATPRTCARLPRLATPRLPARTPLPFARTLNVDVDLPPLCCAAALGEFHLPPLAAAAALRLPLESFLGPRRQRLPRHHPGRVFARQRQRHRHGPLPAG